MKKVVPHRAKKSKFDSGDSTEKTIEHILKRADVDPEKMAWEDRWEPGEHPFVRLEGNRAVCAICLLDFEEPRRVDGAVPDETPAPRAVVSVDEVAQNKENLKAEEGADEEVQEIRVEEVTQEERDRLRLDDAGEGAQPLRLLFCGHVFHVSVCLQFGVRCWLIDSARTANLCGSMAD